MDCPICEDKLNYITRPGVEGIQRFFCESCDVEFYVYPEGNKEGVRQTGWHAHIPLKNFPKKVWEEFLHTERNYYGDVMPSRGSCLSKEDFKRETEYRKRESRKIAEWEKKVG